MHAHAGVQLEAGGFQTLATSRVTAVEDGHVVALRQGVDGAEQRTEVRLGVDVLLAVGGEEHIALGLKAKLRKDVAGLNLLEVGAQHLGHGTARHIDALGGAARVLQVAAGVLGVGQVHVGDDVHYATVGLLGQALVLAAVARLHVEDGDVETLGGNGGKAGVGVAQDEQGVGLRSNHQLVGGRYDVSHRLAQVGTHGVQVHVGVVERQVAEEYAVQGVVVVLPGVGQKAVEVPAALLYDLREPDDLRAGTHDDQQPQTPVVDKTQWLKSVIHNDPIK